MSDTAQGPGWWMATDGKFYPPATPPSPPKKKRDQGIWVVMGVIVAVFVVLALIAGSCSGSSSSSTPGTSVPPATYKIEENLPNGFTTVVVTASDAATLRSVFDAIHAQHMGDDSWRLTVRCTTELGHGTLLTASWANTSKGAAQIGVPDTKTIIYQPTGATCVPGAESTTTVAPADAAPTDPPVSDTPPPAPTPAPAPVTEPPSTPAPPPPTTVAAPPPTTAATSSTVSAGAFCSSAGATGVTSTGKPMVCSTTATDSRLRWRAA